MEILAEITSLIAAVLALLLYMLSIIRSNHVLDCVYVRVSEGNPSGTLEDVVALYVQFLSIFANPPLLNSALKILLAASTYVFITFTLIYFDFNEFWDEGAHYWAKILFPVALFSIFIGVHCVISVFLTYWVLRLPVTIWLRILLDLCLAVVLWSSAAASATLGIGIVKTFFFPLDDSWEGVRTNLEGVLAFYGKFDFGKYLDAFDRFIEIFTFGYIDLRTDVIEWAMPELEFFLTREDQVRLAYSSFNVLPSILYVILFFIALTIFFWAKVHQGSLLCALQWMSKGETTKLNRLALLFGVLGPFFAAAYDVFWN